MKKGEKDEIINNNIINDNNKEENDKDIDKDMKNKLKNQRKLEKKEKEEILLIIYLKKIKKYLYQVGLKLIIKHPFQIVQI